MSITSSYKFKASYLYLYILYICISVYLYLRILLCRAAATGLRTGSLSASVPASKRNTSGHAPAVGSTAAGKKEFLALEGLRSLNRPSNALTLTVLTGTSAVVAFFENRRLPIFFIREKLLRVSFLSLLGYLVLLIR